MQRQHQELTFEGWDQPTTSRTSIKNDGKTGEAPPTPVQLQMVAPPFC